MPPAARVRLDARPHGVVLARPLARALVLAGAGGALAAVGPPVAVAAVLPLALAAAIALRAVWRWERTRLLVTDDELSVVTGSVRRRSASVALERVSAVEVEQGVVGRLLGYGTLVAGDLEIAFVPQPRLVGTLVARLGA